MNQQQIPLEGEIWTENWQLTPEGDFQWFMTSDKKDEKRQLDKRVISRTIVLQFDDEGWLVGIDNNFEKLILDGTGKAIAGLETKQPNQLTGLDRRFFATNFAPPIRPTITNGYVRGPLRYNYYPTYDEAGNLIVYNEEPVKTGNYSTHALDGTSLYPVPEPEPEV